MFASPILKREAILSFGLLALLGSAMALAGCATVNAITMSRSTPAQLGAGVAEGRSPALHSGDRFAFWLWRDDDGTWHLRTTSRSVAHHFQGRIHPLVPDAITELDAVGLEGGRRHRDGLAMVGEDIAFDFTTKGKEDGLDFRLVGETCLEFDLRIDGDGDPGKIFIGQAQTKPRDAHFILCP